MGWGVPSTIGHFLIAMMDVLGDPISHQLPLIAIEVGVNGIGAGSRIQTIAICSTDDRHISTSQTCFIPTRPVGTWTSYKEQPSQFFGGTSAS